MKTKNTLKKALVAICVPALLVSVMPASVFAEEEIEIPEEDYLYVNGESQVLTAGEEMALLCLVVEDPVKFMSLPAAWILPWSFLMILPEKCAVCTLLSSV